MIRTQDDPDPRDLATLEAHINAYNCDQTGYRDGRRFAAFVRSDAGAIEAGISGFTWGGYGKIEFLWITAARRRQGLGTELVAAAEADARAHGCDVIFVDTHDFQAPRFYERLGYTKIGRAEGAPRNCGQTWYRKDLVAT